MVYNLLYLPQQKSWMSLLYTIYSNKERLKLCEIPNEDKYHEKMIQIVLRINFSFYIPEVGAYYRTLGIPYHINWWPRSIHNRHSRCGYNHYTQRQCLALEKKNRQHTHISHTTFLTTQVRPEPLTPTSSSLSLSEALVINLITFY